ncbi:MAG: DHHA1 domain-containing protein [Caldilineales bacterium]|nr:DHHA1 domain-containing protein [Caldilineales bacterium]MDW8317422.1 alanyl-tRNA editing protein [Anaerolineae bacterium]
MTTERLYYRQPTLRSFTAQVTARCELRGQPAVALDRTAFYPAGGGQPHDTGWLNGVPVVDVQEVDGTVWHLLEQPLPPGELVHGELDWRRRWDHMQNHSGQHVLTQAFIRTAEAETVAWHLSDNTVTVDLDRSDLTPEEIALAEALANEIVQEDRPIAARVVGEEELPWLGLRRRPDVPGPLRIVEIADFDRVACGGTHVASTGQIGLIKVLRAERQGRETRIYFVCGGRALADYGRKHRLVRSLAAQLSTGEDDVPQAIARLQGDLQAAQKALRAAQDALVAAEAERLWATAEAGLPVRAIVGLYPDWPAEQVKRLALTLRSRPGGVVALAGGSPPQVFCGRSDDVSADAGQALRAALAAVGGRGGGRSEFAQGSAPDAAAAERALGLAKEAMLAASGGKGNTP